MCWWILVLFDFRHQKFVQLYTLQKYAEVANMHVMGTRDTEVGTQKET